MSDTGPASRRLSGVFAPAVSTFDTWQGALATDPFRANLRSHLAAGVAGVVIAGAAGEAVLLTEEERARLTSLAREEVPRDRWLIVGTGAESTTLTIQRTQAAALRGADAVLVEPPSYYGSSMTRSAMAEHYWRVVDESACPVVLSNAPRHTRLALGAELVHALSAHERVIGLEDCGGDMARLRLYLEAQSPTFSVLVGDGAPFAEALTLGARGGVLGATLYVPALVLEVLRAADAGDVDAMRDARARLEEPSERIAGLGPAGLKAALDAVGLYGGPVRAPLGALTAEQLGAVRLALREAGVTAAATSAR